MPERTLQVLLIDGRGEDSLWVRELLADFGENRYGGGWMHGIEIFPIDRLTDALTLLADQGGGQFDAILLNPTLPDSAGLYSLLRLQACAPAIPVLILAELDDPDLAMSMVRAGAQDFLAKNELDSVPLARAVRLAVERNKTVRQLRAATWRDDLTGLANRTGFDILAGRDLATARRLGRSLAVVLLEVDGLAHLRYVYGKEEQQLALIEAADLLRTSVGQAGCASRVEENRFAISLPCSDPCDVKRLLSLLERRFHHFASVANRSSIALRCGVSWFQNSERNGEASEQFTATELLASAAQSMCANMGDTPQETEQKERHFAAYAGSHRRDV